MTSKRQSYQRSYFTEHYRHQNGSKSRYQKK